jgi:hypothetical protein
MAALPVLVAGNASGLIGGEDSTALGCVGRHSSVHMQGLKEADWRE